MKRTFIICDQILGFTSSTDVFILRRGNKHKKLVTLGEKACGGINVTTNVINWRNYCRIFSFCQMHSKDVRLCNKELLLKKVGKQNVWSNGRIND